MSIKYMNMIWKDSNTRGSERLVLLAIADNCNDEGYAYPAINTIADKCNLSRRQTIEVIKSLESKSLIKVERRKDGAVNKSNLYRITIDGGSDVGSTKGSDVGSTKGGDVGSTRVVLPATPEPLINQVIEPKILSQGDNNGSQKSKSVSRESISGMVNALSSVTGMDSGLNYGRLAREAKSFIQAGYTPGLVLETYGSGGAYWKQDWRGQRGQRPDLGVVRSTIGQLSKTDNQVYDLETKKKKSRDMIKRLEGKHEKI